MDLVQRAIHAIEEGKGSKLLRLGLLVLGIILLTVSYNWRLYRNFATQEAMDAAQLARNLSEGKGYTTDFIRPLSMHLVQQKESVVAAVGEVPDTMRIRGPHPDLANPPVYPVILAGLMKVLPFRYDIPDQPRTFWSDAGRFARHQPDFLIALFNQVLFFGLALVVFRLALRLFNESVAWLAALLLLGTEVLWRFSASGLSTMLLLLIMTGVAWCLVSYSQAVAVGSPSKKLICLALLAGVVVAIGGLTRYAFAWLIIPVMVYVALVAVRQRVMLSGAALLGFVLLFTPWVVRNFAVSGTPFGTAGYALLQANDNHHAVERSLQPQIPSGIQLARGIRTKLTRNAATIIQNEVPAIAGSWLTALFLAGLLVPVQNPQARHVRNFLAAALPLMIVIQALGRTQLSADSPVINSENLLILLAPFLMIFGSSLFVMLLGQSAVIDRLKPAATTAFAVVMSLPLLLGLFSPKMSPLAYPPYFPPLLQRTGQWLEPEYLAMSDIPWALAWYGDRRCIWLTVDSGRDFNAIYIEAVQKPVRLIHLTSRTLESDFISQFSDPRYSWLGVVSRVRYARQPSDMQFPLVILRVDLGQVVLADAPFWRNTDSRKLSN